MAAMLVRGTLPATHGGIVLRSLYTFLAENSHGQGMNLLRTRVTATHCALCQLYQGAANLRGCDVSSRSTRHADGACSHIA